MKNIQKLTLLHFLLICCALPTFGQIGERRSDLAIGFSGGIAMNKVSFEPTVKQKYHMGPTAGITLRYTCEKYFGALCALQVELNYASLGWKEDIHDRYNQPIDETYQRHQHYLQLPFMARLGFGKENKGPMGYIILGPQIGYCFKEKSVKSENFTHNRPSNRYEQYNMSIEKKFEYGITGGAGFELSTNVGHFLIEGRYYYGLSDIFGNSKKDVFARSANGCIIAKVTYLIDVNKKRR